MSQFINARDTLVTDAIDGLVRSQGDRLSRLDAYPHIKVVLRRDWQRDRVALVSGGGSGHEPAHAGFVGRGMLTAAVCGDVFASPSVDAVLAGILAVTGDAGCLLIVKNYTGDRLNFGLAAERARALGKTVSMVIVADDIALPELAQPRGVAGTLFVHKIAGALAEAGESLDAVTSAAEDVTSRLASFGMSLDTCTVPGSEKDDRIDLGKAELGLGIHGEPGVEQIDYSDAAQAMQLVSERLAEHSGDGPHAVLLNNLGGLTGLEMTILANELANGALAERLHWIVGPGGLMTSLDMRGFSVSILPVDEAEQEALASATDAPAWPGLNALSTVHQVELPDDLGQPDFEPSADAEREALIRRCCEILISAESVLNILDAKSGDGDTGSTLAGAAKALQDAVERLPLADATELLRAISTELSQSMGGSSGVLLAIFFSAAADAAADGREIVPALQNGLERISDVGGASIGDRTMIDALSTPPCQHWMRDSRPRRQRHVEALITPRP